MAKELDASDRVVSSIFLAINGLLWLAFCIRMITRWQFIAHGLHVWLIDLAVIVPLLWHSLLKDKSSLSSMTGVSLLFMGVVMVVLSAHLL
jgi:hypothetical protein